MNTLNSSYHTIKANENKPSQVSKIDAITQHSSIGPCTADVFNNHFWGQQTPVNTDNRVSYACISR